MPVDPSSQAAANLAIWLHHILEANSGCARVRRFPPHISTADHVAPGRPLTPGGNTWDGDIAGLLFTAQYTSSHGWTVQFNAC